MLAFPSILLTGLVFQLLQSEQQYNKLCDDDFTTTQDRDCEDLGFVCAGGDQTLFDIGRDCDIDRSTASHRYLPRLRLIQKDNHVSGYGGY